MTNGSNGIDLTQGQPEGTIRLPDTGVPPESTPLEPTLQRLRDLETELEETRRQRDSIAAMARDFGRLLFEQEVDFEAVSKRAEYDDKTGLYKSTVFEAMVRDITAEQSKRQDDMHSLILADLDNFHEVNEALGYLETDTKCLIPAARIMKQSVREVDIVSRWGGEEFAIFLRGAPLLAAVGVAFRIQHAINAIQLPAQINGRGYLGVSLGVVRFPQGAAYENIFYNANRYLTLAKKSGRNLVISDDTAKQQPS